MIIMTMIEMKTKTTFMHEKPPKLYSTAAQSGSEVSGGRVNGGRLTQVT